MVVKPGANKCLGSLNLPPEAASYAGGGRSTM